MSEAEETHDEKLESKETEASSSFGPNISEIGNKEMRHQQYVKLKRDKKKEKKKRQDDRKKVAEALGDQAPPKLIPKTIDSMREADETTVATGETAEEQDEEVMWDISNDEFKDYFGKTYEPKVLITTGDNPHTVSFMGFFT